MASLAGHLAPHLDLDLDIDVQPNKRQRPVESGRTNARPDGGGGRAKRRTDFDMKGKARAEISPSP